jgi:hypothetical protein
VTPMSETQIEALLDGLLGYSFIEAAAERTPRA